MLGSDDTAAAQQGHLVPSAHFHKRLVCLADKVKNKSAVFASAVIVGCKMENAHSGISVLEELLEN